MAKGQQKSNREAKKPKKTTAEKLKASTPVVAVKGVGDKGPAKKG